MAETPKELANLARLGKLKSESGTRGEITGLLASGAEGAMGAFAFLRATHESGRRALRSG